MPTSRYPRRSSVRRKTSWAVGPTSSGVQTITAPSVTLMTLGSQVLEDGLTLTRIRGELDLAIRTADADGSGMHGAFGICYMTENAFGIGSTAVPDPVADEFWNGWIWHRYWSVFEQLTGSTNGYGFVRLEIDSKAQRKEKAADVLVGVLTVAEVGTIVMDVVMRSRILVKLP